MSEFQKFATCKHFYSKTKCPNHNNEIMREVRNPIASADYEAAYRICAHCEAWESFFKSGDYIRSKSGDVVMRILNLINRTYAKCQANTFS